MENKKIKSYIIETRIGLFYDRAFSKKEDISNIKTLLGNEFEFIRDITNKEISIKPKENSFQEFFDGCYFESKDKKQRVFFQRERLLFVDNAEYISFEHLMEKYNKVLSILTDSFFTGVKFKHILMTAVNNILCPFGKELSIAPFLPYLNLKTDKQTTNVFALMVSHGTMSSLVKNPDTAQQLDATITSRIPGTTKDKMFPLSLNIDTGAVIENNNIDYIKSRLQDMRKFRNEIFFSNIGEELKYE